MGNRIVSTSRGRGHVYTGRPSLALIIVGVEWDTEAEDGHVEATDDERATTTAVESD